MNLTTSLFGEAVHVILQNSLISEENLPDFRMQMLTALIM